LKTNWPAIGGLFICANFLVDIATTRNIIPLMNVIRGPWTESGANFDPNLVIVREAVIEQIASMVRLCEKVGVKVSELEVDAIEDTLWQKELMKPGSHLQSAYPGLLEEAAGNSLDSYYAAA
jgi:hypothetical protein